MQERLARHALLVRDLLAAGRVNQGVAADMAAVRAAIEAHYRTCPSCLHVLQQHAPATVPQHLLCGTQAARVVRFGHLARSIVRADGRLGWAVTR
jgi:hypothetical protein